MKLANNINPAMLAWARNSAGLDPAEAADRLSFLRSKDKKAAEERLTALENGERKPTRAQLQVFSRAYRCPLVTFYLKQPPARGDRWEDFRRSRDSVSRRENALLDILLRDTRARQEMIRELLKEEEGFDDPLAFVGSADTGMDADSVAESIASTLRFDRRDPALRRGGAAKLFRLLREKAQSTGIFVLLVGDLGSHDTVLSPNVFRGIAVSDGIAPFVVVNDRDACAARSFALVRELAHIWLDRSGVSGAPEFDTPRNPLDRIERFCSDVACEFLLPTAALASEVPTGSVVDGPSAESMAESLARTWSVSESTAALQLARTGVIARETCRDLLAADASRCRRCRQPDGERDRRRASVRGPDCRDVRAVKLGRALVELVCRSVRDDVLTHTKAAFVLDVTPGAVEPLLRRFERRRQRAVPDAA